MARTSTDQWWGEKLKIAQQETEQAQAENAQLKLMIAGKGGSPGQPYDDPEKGKGPFVPAPPRDKLAHGEGRGPQPLYHDEYNRPLDMPPWIQMFDTVMERGDPLAAFFAVRSLSYRYLDAQGRDGTMVTGTAPRGDGSQFQSQAEVVEAMSDRRYDRDPAFRQKIMKKLERSDINF